MAGETAQLRGKAALYLLVGGPECLGGKGNGVVFQIKLFVLVHHAGKLAGQHQRVTGGGKPALQGGYLGGDTFGVCPLRAQLS